MSGKSNLFHYTGTRQSIKSEKEIRRLVFARKERVCKHAEEKKADNIPLRGLCTARRGGAACNLTPGGRGRRSLLSLRPA